MSSMKHMDDVERNRGPSKTSSTGKEPTPLLLHKQFKRTVVPGRVTLKIIKQNPVNFLNAYSEKLWPTDRL